jgi:glycosyltransferase involved in cell wall biosynthesis
MHNRHAALYFLREVWPMLRQRYPQARYYAAGANPPPELQAWHDGDRVNVTGYVPSLQPYFARAAVYVCTVMQGAGMLNKVQDAMAWGVPVVCSRVAADGLRLEHGKHVLIADEPAAFVDRILEVVNNPEGSAERAHRARQFVEEEYTWSAHVSKLEQAYGEILQSRRGEGATARVTV